MYIFPGILQHDENVKPNEHYTKYRCSRVSRSVELNVMQFDWI